MQGTSKKNLIIIIVVVIVAVGAYFYFSGAPDDSSVSSLEAEGSLEAASSMAAGANVLNLLNQVSQINIDATFFESTAYKSLVDNTVVVPEQNVGRANPFAPVPGVFAAPANPGAGQ